MLCFCLRVHFGGHCVPTESGLRPSRTHPCAGYRVHEVVDVCCVEYTGCPGWSGWVPGKLASGVVPEKKSFVEAVQGMVAGPRAFQGRALDCFYSGRLPAERVAHDLCVPFFRPSRECDAVRYLARAMTYLLGAVLSAVGSTMFLAFWFSSTEELQGLKEVYET